MKRFIYIFFMITTSLCAQYYNTINTHVVWQNDTVISAPIVISSGGRLTVQHGVNVKILNVDVDKNGIGDIYIKTLGSGQLICNGSVADPVSFEAYESVPANNHWTGVILANNGTYGRDSLKNVTIKNAYNGIESNNPVYLENIFLNNIYNSGLIINNYTSTKTSNYFGINIRKCSGIGVIINKSAIKLENSLLDTVLSNGIILDSLCSKINIENCRINNATTGIINNSNTTATDSNQVENSIVTHCTKSGIFNKKGYLKIVNSLIENNGYNGLLSSVATTIGQNLTIKNNTLRGILVGGKAKINLAYSTIQSNSSYGFDIIQYPLNTDSNPVIDTNKLYGKPIITVYKCNILNNKGGADSVQARSRLRQVDTVSNFNYNWWGKDSGINQLIQQRAPGSLNYLNAELSNLGNSVTNQGTYSITFNDSSYTTIISAANNPRVRGYHNIKWNYTGDFPYVRLQIDNRNAANDNWVSGTKIDTIIPNSGSFWIGIKSHAVDHDSMRINLTPYINGATSGATSTNYIVFKNNSGMLIYPKYVRDSLQGSSTVNIKWACPTDIATNVDIKLVRSCSYYPSRTYSPIIIASGVSTPNTLGNYSWTVPNDSVSDKTVIKIYKAGTATLLDESDSIKIMPNPQWVVDSSSGKSMRITINGVRFNYENLAALTPIFRNISTNDYIGAFISGNDNVCAGFTRWKGRGTVLKIWGDNNSTLSKVEGMRSGEIITFKLWRPGWFKDGISPIWDLADKNSDSTMNVYKSNASSYVIYSESGTDVIDSLKYSRSNIKFTTDVAQTISLKNGWNLISSYIYPSTTAISVANRNVTGLLSGINPMFVIMKNGKGDVLWKEENISQISNWDYKQGYYIKVNKDTNLVMGGAQSSIVVPNYHPISLQAGWNQIAYLRKYDMPISNALRTVEGKITIVKDGDGKVYWPGYNINDLTVFEPGKGYLVKAINACELTYPANTILPKQTGVLHDSLTVKHFINIRKSSSNTTIFLPNNNLKAQLEIGDEVAVFNTDGKLCGASIYKGGNMAISAFGQSECDTFGFRSNEKISDFRVWKKNSNTELKVGEIEFENFKEFTQNGIVFVRKFANLQNIATKITNYELKQNYPNPFNPVTNISYSIPEIESKNLVNVVLKVYDILGREVVTLVNTKQASGSYKVAFNAANLPSGIYIAKIQADKFNKTIKMMLLK